MIAMPMVGISSLRVSSKLEARDAKMNDEGEFSQLSGTITSTIQRLKKQILANRIVLVKEKIESNKKVIEKLSSQLLMLSKSRDANNSRNDEIKSPLTLRMESSLCKLGGLDLVGGDNEDINCQDDGSNTSSTIIFGSNLGGKSIVRPSRIPMLQKIPPYTTWIFLDRNQIMAEDQSVVGRRRIYYDQNGSEALICSDSEEDPVDEEDEKYDFSEGDDQMIQATIQEHGLKEEVLESISQFFGVKLPEVQSRYEFLKQQQQKKQFVQNGDDETDVNNMPIGDIFVGKDLDSAMDSYDNLFCRRCLVFDCRLHGCSQPLVFPCEKQPPWSCSDEESRIPCGNNCYRLEHMKVEEAILSSSTGVASEDNRSLHGCKEGFKVNFRRKVSAPTDSKSTKIVQSDSACSSDKQPNECSHVDTNVACDGDDNHDKENPIQRQDKKNGDTVNRNPKRTAEQVLASMRKKQRKIASDLGSSVSGGNLPADVRTKSRKASSKIVIGKKAKDMSNSRKSVGTENFDDNVDNWDEQADFENEKKIITEGDTLQSEVSSCKIEEAADCVSKLERTGWCEIEKSLYAKGLEIFGKNSCLIARNLLHGIKSCSEVAEYMNHIEFRQGKVECGTISRTESSGKGTEVRTRTRFWRRRGRVRRLKYTWKSAGHPSIRKRIADSKDQPCRQYTPCDCQSTCGKQCPCLRSGTCCEKYCGCSKVCKNRFRGCHCAKSQCRSRQCPCFAAGRECDPDVCRNCWVGCGDGTLGGPPQRGDNYECRNMKLLLKQQQRVLLGRSDVSGWGAFLKNSVNKHDYLGEYTGELISHREADKRGKIYDRENSSFLFNLNDQYVLDAYRKGDKLKFANHSPTPNCYAKVIMVAGDHRVGIFAKERICGGEELFYDYRYEPDKAPAWARKPEDSTAKRDDTTATSHGRAQKLAR